MSKNKIIIYVTVLIIILLITIPSILLIMNNHNSKLLESTEKKIIETAKNCYYSESCVEEYITLSELNDKMGLELLANPITKKVYNKDSYVDVKNNFSFIEIK